MLTNDTKYCRLPNCQNAGLSLPKNSTTDCYLVSTPIAGLSPPNFHISTSYCQNAMTDCYHGLPQLPAYHCRSCHCQIASLRPLTTELPYCGLSMSKISLPNYYFGLTQLLACHCRSLSLPNCHIAACYCQNVITTLLPQST